LTNYEEPETIVLDQAEN